MAIAENNRHPPYSQSLTEKIIENKKKIIDTYLIANYSQVQERITDPNFRFSQLIYPSVILKIGPPQIHG
jgi:hypothetical protein